MLQNSITAKKKSRDCINILGHSMRVYVDDLWFGNHNKLIYQQLYHDIYVKNNDKQIVKITYVSKSINILYLH